MVSINLYKELVFLRGSCFYIELEETGQGTPVWFSFHPKRGKESIFFPKI